MAWNARLVTLSEERPGLECPVPSALQLRLECVCGTLLKYVLPQFKNQNNETNTHATRLNLTSSSLFPYNSGKKKCLRLPMRSRPFNILGRQCGRRISTVRQCVRFLMSFTTNVAVRRRTSPPMWCCNEKPSTSNEVKMFGSRSKNREM